MTDLFALALTGSPLPATLGDAGPLLAAPITSALPWPDLGTTDIGLAQATIATLGTILFVGLGFLARPRRSTLLWSLMFMGLMVACFAYLAAVTIQSEELRRAALGLLMGMTALLWSGLRAYRGVPTRAWLSPLIAAAAIAAFLISGDSDWYPLAYRIAFFVSAIFAALFLVEWRAMPERNERILIPVVAISAVYALAGVTVLAGAFFPEPATIGALAPLRLFNSVGMLICMVCILISLVPLSTPGAQATEAGAVRNDWAHFTATARERLERAAARGETSWSILRIELDDADDIRLAGGLPIFARLIQDIRTRVRTVFPSDADVAIAPDGAVIVLVSRPEAVVRDLVRQTLQLIAVRDPAAPITVTTSASIGWTRVASSYDLDALLEVAGAAASSARRSGGDRWERVSA